MIRLHNLPRPIPLMIGLSLILGGCAQYQMNRNPQFSDMVVSADSIPEVNRIQIPLPEPLPIRIPQRAEAASLWQTNSTGFFGDQRASKVGDILTVLIEIDDKAALENASERESSGATELGFPSFFGYGGQIAAILPGGNSRDLPSGNIVDLSSGSSSAGSGSINRNEKINLKVAALIIQRLSNGNLVIAGRQEVRVNQELRELRVAGIIRPVDILMNNTVSYEKIAEARIAYGGRGQISRVQQPRYGSDLLEVVLPY